MRSLLPVFLFASLLGAQTATYAVFTQVNPALQPPDRDRAQMAYDEARGRVLLAGGRTPGGGSTLQDTWEWNGTAWQQVFPATQLNFSKIVRLVYSPQRAQILAVSGDDVGSGPPMVIHGWTGTNWVLVNANGPMSRADTFEIAWDGQRGVLVMFGSPYGAETWEWNGLTWSQVGSGGPLPRSKHRMTYDENRQRVVLCGGLSHQNQWLSDTWEWNGVYWLERWGITPPGTQMNGVIAYDRARQRVVLHGGTWQGNDVGGVWAFNGTNWIARQTSGAPAGMHSGSMAYWSPTGSMLLFGGLNGSTFQRTRTISFVTGYVASGVAHQPGCLGPVGVPTLAPVGVSRPQLGTTFQLRFTNLPNTPLAVVFAALGFSDQTWSGVPLPLNLTPFGFTSCLLHIEPSVMELLSNVGGVADWNIAVPATLGLDGMQFFLQGLVVTPGFNPGGGVMSSSLRCTAGVL